LVPFRDLKMYNKAQSFNKWSSKRYWLLLMYRRLYGNLNLKLRVDVSKHFYNDNYYYIRVRDTNLYRNYLT